MIKNRIIKPECLTMVDIIHCLTLNINDFLLIEKQQRLAGSFKMDETGAKILKILLIEPRTSFSEIAKKCGLSTQAVQKRYERMKKSGIINGAIIQVNPKYIGLTCCGVLNVVAVKNKKQEIDRFLLTKNCVINDYPSNTDDHIIKMIGASDVEKFARIVEELQARPYVKSVDPIIWIDETNMTHPENIIILIDATNNVENGSYDFYKPSFTDTKTGQKSCDTENELNKPPTIDEVDRKIAKILSQNARMPFSKVAEKVGITTSTVIKRYNQMRKNNFIHLSSVTVNLEKLGYNAILMFFLKLSRGSDTSKLFNHIVQIPNVIIAIRTLGSYDMSIAVPIINFEQVFSLTRKISRIENIEDFKIEVHKPFQKFPNSKYSSIL